MIYRPASERVPAFPEQQEVVSNLQWNSEVHMETSMKKERIDPSAQLKGYGILLAIVVLSWAVF